MTAMPMRSFAAIAPQVLDIENGDAAARLLSHFVRQRVEERGDLKPFLPKPRIVGQRQAEVAGAEDRHLELPLEARESAEGAASDP